MFRFGFIATFILAVLSCNQSPETVVKLHVDGEKGDFNPTFITKDSTYQSTLDSLGNATFTLADNLQPGYASIQYGRIVLPVYAEPGKSFDLNLALNGRNVTPQFSGKGAKKNEYLNNPVLQRYFPDFKQDEEAFITSLDQQVKTFYASLDSMNFDEQFNKLEKKRLHYMVYNALNMYPSYHAYYAQVQDYVPSGKFYDKLQSVISEEEALLNMPEYKDALSGFVGTISAKEMQAYNSLEMIKNELDYIAKNIKSPALAEYLVHHFAMGHIGRSGVDNLDIISPVYNAKVTDPAKKEKFEKVCSQWAKIAKGQPSPGFKYTDINGKEVSLEDLAGKYVYIDVWATWCGPCRGELPHLKELEHQFEKKNIHFVSISCDQDKAAWEKMVKADQLGGIQLHANNRDFMEAYIIRGIPRFILLDREGKIIASNMTRPSNPETARTLNALEGI